MKGSKIIVSDNPKGHFEECVVHGTPKPGTVMQVQAGTAAVGGRFEYEVYNPAADGDQRLIAVLLEKEHEGKIYSDAYVDGDRGYLYFPVMGEELNMLVANISGTSDTFAIADILMVDDGTGKLIATTGTPESEPFIMMETVSTALTADTHCHVKFTGY